MYRAFLIPDSMPLRAIPLGQSDIFTDARDLIRARAQKELGPLVRIEELADDEQHGWDYLAHAPGRFNSLQFTIESAF